MNDLEALLVAHIAEHGPIGFDDFVDHALYTPGLGFYGRGGGAGRRRDFLTSPEVGPLFGAVVANALDSWWGDLGRPDPFVVVEAGAGPGTLARTILAAGPRCGPALRLVLVETAEVQWSTHPREVISRPVLPAPGELVDGPLVVLANELLDNLPFGLVELTEHGWAEVLVGAAPSPPVGPAAAALVEVVEPLDARRSGWCWGRAGRTAPVGTRLPVQAAAAAWLDEALTLAGPGGRVVACDYASTTRHMAQRPWVDWLRTYSRHGRAGHPLVDVGSCDITVEVAVDQLATVAAPALDRSQSEFLEGHGLGALVAEGAARWRAEGVRGGLGAIAGRSRVHEAEALTDPAGLGGFRVLEWCNKPAEG